MAGRKQPHGPITDAIREHEAELLRLEQDDEAVRRYIKAHVPPGHRAHADKGTALSVHAGRHPLYFARLVAAVVRDARPANRVAVAIAALQAAALESVEAVKQHMAETKFYPGGEPIELLRTLEQVAALVAPLPGQTPAPARRGAPSTTAGRVRYNVIAALVNATRDDKQPSPAEIAHYVHELTGESLTIREVSRDIGKILDDERRLITHPHPTRPQARRGRYL